MSAVGNPVNAPREGLIRVEPSAREKVIERSRAMIMSDIDVIDLAFTAALVSCALVGFRTGYFGWQWILAGVSGLLLGLAVSHVTTAYRLPAVATLAALAVVYFLLGGPLAVRNHLIGGVLPSAQTLDDLASALITGWKRLLTMLPPIDASGPLLALPFVVGLVGAAVTYAVARRWQSPYAVVLAPLGLLALSIALGTLEPASLTMQGVAFGLLAIGWMVVRAARNRPPLQNGAGQRARAITGTALLAAAALAGTLVGPHLPGADDTNRAVARSVLEPPYDVAQFPSPLAGFRKYTEPNSAKLWDRILMRVKGVPAGTPVRFAALDDYNGSVWGASNRADNGSHDPGAAFQQVGSRIASSAEGTPATMTVSVPEGGYSDVWLPEAGAIRGVKFHGPRAARQQERLWLNIDTATAIVPSRIGPGDTYDLTVVLPKTPGVLPKTEALSSGSLTNDADLGFLDARVDSWSGEGGDAWTQLRAVAAAMQSEGTYTDGGTKNNFERLYLPGHSIGRLSRFAGSSQLAGNDEQYAATFALIANRLSIPARVVMGAITPADGVVKGKDVHAWVEVRTEQGAWIPLLPKDFVPDRNKKPNQQQIRSEQRKVGALVPPPAGVNPPSVLQGPDQAQNATNIKKRPKRIFNPGSWPAWLRWIVFYLVFPALVLFGLYALIRVLKARVRARHATRGPTAGRIAWAWTDLVDHARSMGETVPRQATRLEQSVALKTPGVETHGLAARANAHVFGPGEPTDEEARSYWAATDEVRDALRAGAPVWKKLKSDLDLRPLFSRQSTSPSAARRVASLRLPRKASTA